MKLQIKRLEGNNLELPKYKTEGSAGMDLTACIDENIILFTGKKFVNDEQTGISGYSQIPYKPFFSDMKDVKGYLVEPNFKNNNMEHHF